MTMCAGSDNQVRDSDNQISKATKDTDVVIG